jgi:AcrR family transcriptional regulator
MSTADGGRERLLAAARVELAEVGTAGISLRAIARRAGVSHAAPKHHFGDRAGLLTALATEGFEQLRRALEQAAAAASRPKQRLTALGRAYLSVALANPATFDLMFRSDMLRPDDARLNQERQAAYELLRHGVADAHETTPDRTNVAWAFIHGLSILVRDGALPTASDRRRPAAAIDDLVAFFAAKLMR